MRIKGMIILWMLLFGITRGLLAQQVDSTVYFQGEWEIEKAEVKIYAQRGGKLLEQHTLVNDAQMQSVNTFIRMINVSFQNCEVQYSSRSVSGYISISGGKIILMKYDLSMPEAVLPYRFEGSKLVVIMPDTYYNSAVHDQPVKQCVVCRLKKKS